MSDINEGHLSLANVVFNFSKMGLDASQRQQELESLFNSDPNHFRQSINELSNVLDEAYYKRNAVRRSALHVASELNFVETIKLLVQNGADVNLMLPSTTNTPLDYALYVRSFDAVKVLCLDFDANIASGKAFKLANESFAEMHHYDHLKKKEILHILDPEMALRSLLAFQILCSRSQRTIQLPEYSQKAILETLGRPIEGRIVAPKYMAGTWLVRETTRISASKIVITNTHRKICPKVSFTFTFMLIWFCFDMSLATIFESVSSKATDANFISQIVVGMWGALVLTFEGRRIFHLR